MLLVVIRGRPAVCRMASLRLSVALRMPRMNLVGVIIIAIIAMAMAVEIFAVHFSLMVLLQDLVLGFMAKTTLLV